MFDEFADIKQSRPAMRLLTIIWLVLFCAATSLRAQTANKTNGPTRPISLQESIEMALRGNLGVEIERINIQIARYSLSAAYGDWDPFLSASASHSFSSNPSGFDSQGRPIPSTLSDSDNLSAGIGGPGVGAFGLLPSGLAYSLSGNASDTVFHRPLLLTNNTFLDTRTETSRAGLSLSLRQPILKNFWVDGTRLKIKVSKNRLKYYELGLQQQVMAVVNSVTKAYYELIFARENIKVQETALQLAEKLVSENKKKVQVGTLAALDEKSAEAQAASSMSLLLDAQNTKFIQENALKRLLTGNLTPLHETELLPSEVMSATIPILNVQASWARGMTERPDLLQARLDIEQQNIQVRYTHNQLFPQLDLIGSYGFTGASTEFSGALAPIGSGSNPNYSFGAALTIPLGNRLARANHHYAQEQKKYYLLQLKDKEQTILAAIDNAVKAVQISFEKIEATRQARIFYEAALDAEQKKLESGKSTPYNVLLAQRDVTNARKDEIRSLANYLQALSDLHFQEGSILERHHLTVEVEGN